MENTCGQCRWHYAHEAAVERVGWKNCLALSYPGCTHFYSKPEAACSFPERFELMPTLEDFVEERNTALLALDLDWARRALPQGLIASPTDDFLLLCMHKARVDCKGIPTEARKESAVWLRDRGFHTTTGQVPDPENLPV